MCVHVCSNLRGADRCQPRLLPSVPAACPTADLTAGRSVQAVRASVAGRGREQPAAARSCATSGASLQLIRCSLQRMAALQETTDTRAHVRCSEQMQTHDHFLIVLTFCKCSEYSGAVYIESLLRKGQRSFNTPCLVPRPISCI